MKKLFLICLIGLFWVSCREPLGIYDIPEVKLYRNGEEKSWLGLHKDTIPAKGAEWHFVVSRDSFFLEYASLCSNNQILKNWDWDTLKTDLEDEHIVIVKRNNTMRVTFKENQSKQQYVFNLAVRSKVHPMVRWHFEVMQDTLKSQ